MLSERICFKSVELIHVYIRKSNTKLTQILFYENQNEWTLKLTKQKFIHEYIRKSNTKLTQIWFYENQNERTLKLTKQKWFLPFY